MLPLTPLTYLIMESNQLGHYSLLPLTARVESLDSELL